MNVRASVAGNEIPNVTDLGAVRIPLIFATIILRSPKEVAA